MNKVWGKVLVKESGVGIADLVVVIIDVDSTSTEATAALPSVFWSGSGERIGSVLTDAAGRFELEFDAALFAAGDAEKRPDLVLGVFAPEDGVNATPPTALPPHQRLLVFSNIPRQNAGASEAYVLRISREQLGRFGIGYAGAHAPSADLAEQVITAYTSRQALADKLRMGLAPMRKARLQRQREVVAKAKTFVHRLGAAPLAFRTMKTFVGLGNDLPTAARAAMERGLVSLQQREPGRPLVYGVTQEDLVAGGLTTPGVVEMAPVYEELTHEQLCRMIGRRRGGMALQRVMGLIDARAAEAEGHRRVSEITATQPGDGDSPGPPEPPPPPGPNGVDPITAGVLAQLQGLTTPAANPASTIEELGERLAGFSLPPGPADVTSFHDFHQLQIAFEHVWTEAFDEGLRDRVQDLYETTVQVVHDGEPADMPTELAEMNEVEQFMRDLAGISEAMAEVPPDAVSNHLPEAALRWSTFSPDQQRQLWAIAADLERIAQGVATTQDSRQLNADAAAIIMRPAGLQPRLVRLLDEIKTRLAEPYAFHYFAPNQVNFGILLTYRQTWKPLTYQVGDLVSTIPLAPGETRRFSSKTVIKRTRAQKELEKSLSSRSGESTQTQRADAEITTKASTTTNFRHTAEGSFTFGIGSLEATAEFVMNQAQESASVKRSFHEAVVKAASEYKQERALEIETTQESSDETTSSGEIANTNNEMTVTYLLYELERQYRIAERIHRVMPVILVAQEMPGPHRITESWLLAHEWILRRVLLDDGLLPALDQLSRSFAGDELSLGVKKANWQSQRSVVEKLEATVLGLISSRDVMRQNLLDREEAKALIRAARNAEGFLMDLAQELTVDVGQGVEDTTEARVKKIKKELEFVQESLASSQQQLASAQEALTAATKEYTQALEAQTNRRVAIDQLRVHVKQNILYYMQAVWDHEPPDQRFFRLYHQPVNLPEAASAFCRLRLATDDEIALGIETICRQGHYYVVEGCEAPQLPDPEHPNTKQLVEIADLDKPLGYKGNYIIFPLKTCVYLTEFMMKEFVDGYLGVRDPDDAANYGTDELLDYIQAIWNDPTAALTQQQRDAALNLVLQRVREPRRESDVIVVPTGQLFIEALLGSHPLLEPFKQVHRAYDVGKARAELRQAELDNLRRAARLLAGERDDPDIDRRVVVSGAGEGVIVGSDG